MMIDALGKGVGKAGGTRARMPTCGATPSKEFPWLPTDEEKIRSIFFAGRTVADPAADPDKCPALEDPYAGYYGSSAAYGLDDEIIQFAWTPPFTTPDEDIRLFLIATDEGGGQTWQELSVTPTE